MYILIYIFITFIQLEPQATQLSKQQSIAKIAFEEMTKEYKVWVSKFAKYLSVPKYWMFDVIGSVYETSVGIRTLGKERENIF